MFFSISFRVYFSQWCYFLLYLRGENGIIKHDDDFLFPSPHQNSFHQLDLKKHKTYYTRAVSNPTISQSQTFLIPNRITATDRQKLQSPDSDSDPIHGISDISRKTYFQHCPGNPISQRSQTLKYWMATKSFLIKNAPFVKIKNDFHFASLSNF